MNLYSKLFEKRFRLRGRTATEQSVLYLDATI